LIAVLIAVVPGRGAAETGGDTGDPARAARTAELNEAGARLYRERSYHRAIEKFVEAYATDRDPNLLYNIARCYEELGDTRSAIEKYTAYINAPGADAAGRLRAEQSLRALLELQKRGAPAPKEVPAGSPDVKEQVTETSSSEAPAAASSGAGVLAWSALGAGALVTALGGAAFYLGMRDHDRITDSPDYGNPGTVDPLTMAEARDLASSGDTKKLGGAIALGVGGALLATSAVLFLLPRRSSEERAPASGFAFGWAPGASGFRAGWSVRF
jgi:hypothetical protein